MSIIPKLGPDLKAPELLSSDDMKWLATSIYWHLVLKTPLTDEAHDAIGKIRQDTSKLYKRFQDSLKAMQDEEGLEARACDQILAFINMPSSQG